MPDALRMKLDHIKRYLYEGKAAAMIGAGFSKNAKIPDAAEMKDWNALGIEFYKRLYGQPKSESIFFQNPINLATQVEACFGRHELDNMIQQSLPDDAIIPSQLHVDLLNLGWHDIFTTNYDTLLERACLNADHSYTIVYNKDTLLYSQSPRVVKLHGSFPNIRPYIITEEDYRTYPMLYPEFVNTVRQSLIENLFCLIGFSGDDPNFKSWLGWLRDVMGQQISPVYFITYDKYLHDSRRNLLSKQKIEVLNLCELQQVKDIQEAFDFFFTYLKDESSTKWNGRLGHRVNSIEDIEQIRQLTREMSEIRKSYPGWLVLPQKYYDDFQDVSSHMLFWRKIADLQGLLPKEWFQFLYELKWRLETSLTPISADWYVKALDALSLDNLEDRDILIDLKLTLLTHYRVSGKEEEYFALNMRLRDCMSQFKPVQVRRYYYDRCLMASSRMDYAQLKIYLAEWQVYDTDYVGALWKSSMLMEAGLKSDALNLLNKASIQIRKTILTNQNESVFFKSCQVAIERALYIYDGDGPYNINHSCDYLNEIKYFREQINKGTIYGATSTKSHGFNIGDVITTWHVGTSGYVSSYLFSYRYYSLCELVGIPAGIPESTLNTDDHILFLKHYFKYNHYYSMGVLARSCNNKAILNVLCRKTMSYFSKELASKYFDAFFEYADHLDKINDNFVRIHIYKSCIPILVRLCSKVSADRTTKMAIFLQRAHGQYLPFEEHYEIEFIKTVNNSLRIKGMEESISKMFDLPIQLSLGNGDDYYYPAGWSEGISFSAEAVQWVCEGLDDADNNVQEAAFLRGYQILRGVINDEDRERLKLAVVKWRNTTADLRHVCFSFIDVPPVEFDRYSQSYFVEKYVKDIMSIDVDNVNNSLVFDHLAECYRQLSYCNNLLGGIDATPIIQQFCDLVHKNKKQIEKNEEDLFGGFRNNITNVVHQFHKVLRSFELMEVNTDVLKELVNVEYILGDAGYSYLGSLMWLQRYKCGLKETDIKQLIQESIIPTAPYRQAMDVLNALLILNERGRSYQNLLYQIISLCEYSTDRSVVNWLYVLYNLADKHAIKETSLSKVNHLLETRFNNNNYNEEDTDWLSDVRHGTALVAGAIVKEWGHSDATNKWKSLLDDDSDEFNDVSCAFERASYGKPVH